MGCWVGEIERENEVGLVRLRRKVVFGRRGWLCFYCCYDIWEGIWEDIVGCFNGSGVGRGRDDGGLVGGEGIGGLGVFSEVSRRRFGVRD